MRAVRARRLAAGVLAGALLAAAALPAGAQTQESSLTGVVRAAVRQLERVMSDRRPPPDRPPATLRSCTELYPPQVLQVARGHAMAVRHQDWLLDSYEVMREVYGELPFPICFRWRVDVVDTNLGRYLLDVNAHFVFARFKHPRSEAERRFYPGYLLTGYLDPAETDTALARRRADRLEAQLPGLPCQYASRGEPAGQRDRFHRKVYFSFRPAIPTCPRTPD
jgi:hypothetical protein